MSMNIRDLVTSRQSPILTTERVESTSQYSLRVTPYSKYGVLEFERFLKQFPDWIYSIENSKTGKEHYHSVIWTNLFEEDVRTKVRAFLLEHFIDKPKRGDANKQYNLSEVQDIEATVTYLLKDDGVIKYSDNVNPDAINKLRKNSYKKFSKEEFAKQLEELKAEFKTTSPLIGIMMEKVIQLKAVYRQPINVNQVYQMCVSYEIHNDPNAASFYVSQFLSRFK